MTTQTFFDYQHRALNRLKYWGLGSMGVGLLAGRQRSPLLRHVGVQCFVWGAIDTALAVAGQRNARHKATQATQGTLSEAQTAREIRKLHRILILNTGLDVGYVLAGLGLLLVSEEADRHGMALGILAQGSFLLIYDALLAHDIARNWPGEVQAL